MPDILAGVVLAAPSAAATLVEAGVSLAGCAAAAASPPEFAELISFVPAGWIPESAANVGDVLGAFFCARTVCGVKLR
jgi:hypothetical protein